MPGLSKRAYTSYDFYPTENGKRTIYYPVENWGEIERTRSPDFGGFTSDPSDRLSPHISPRSPSRGSPTRLLGSRPFRIQQPDYRPGCTPEPHVARSPSPQPWVAYSARDRPLDYEEMDPMTRQYYNRLWMSHVPETNPSFYRMGRAGGQWRHVRACTANTGSHMVFIDGVIKQSDNVPHHTQELEYQRPISPKLQANYPTLKRNKDKYNNIFREHAKNNFVYWPRKPQPVKLAAQLKLKARQVGLGY